MQQYFIIFLPAFLLGMLHTAIPCEDKAIFCFWSSGISKTPKNSVFILIIYGLGLICANLIFASITILISFIPRFLGFVPDPYAINFFGAFSSTFAAIILLFLITRRDYAPHTKSRYHENFLQFNWEKKRTPFLFGIITGFTPCIFELIIYSQCLQYSLSYGFGQAFLLVFYFSLGTFVGLFPLALAKHSTAQFIKTKEDEQKRNRIFYAMIFIIIIFNTIIMILSFLRIDVFPVEHL
ncbi:MAG: urease accessory protein UreH domain-containing protein [Promethearchaeota archaeon]